MPATPPQEKDTRRSLRIFRRVPVKVRGMNAEGQKFRESCQTIVLNAHGGLLYLNESVEMGGQLQLENPVTEEEQECRIVYLGDNSDRGQRVGVEFLSPAPHFWGVEFAAPDASGRRPSPSQ
ncbi:MAG: hypothetical protein WBE20_16270 [Candidatus Acidiferrales bacterium]